MSALLPSWTPADGARRATALFRTALGGDPDGVWAAPGRVNLIGEHTDYNAGLCLPIALPHRTFVALRRREDDQVRLVSSLNPDQVWTGSLADIVPGGVRGWVSYGAGPAWALRAEGHDLGGFEAAFASCVPLGAGLSSSAAIECAIALGLDDSFGLGIAEGDAGRAELARLCVRAENEVSKAPTGGLDQAASLRCTAGHALLLDARDSSVTQVPFDLESAGLALLVIDTRAHHSLVDGQYGARRATCEAAAAALGLPSLREIDDLDAALAQLPDPVMQARVRHVVTENARVEEFVRLVSAAQVAEAAALMPASHASLRDDYEVSCAELDVAVDTAIAAGALGARMTGGGFGGSAIAIVAADEVPRVSDAVAAAFAAHGFTAPHFLAATAAGPGARVA